MPYDVTWFERRAMRRREDQTCVWPALAKECAFFELAVAVHVQSLYRNPRQNDHASTGIRFHLH